MDILLSFLQYLLTEYSAAMVQKNSTCIRKLLTIGKRMGLRYGQEERDPIRGGRFWAGCAFLMITTRGALWASGSLVVLQECKKAREEKIGRHY